MGVLAPASGSGSSGTPGEGGVEEEGGVGGGKGDQDVLVPWVLQEDQKKKEKKRKRKVVPRTTTSKQNGKSGEDHQVDRNDGDDGVQQEDVAAEPEMVGDEPTPDPPRQVYHRYYHLYTEGELREDVIRAAEGMGFDVITLPRDSDNSADKNKDADEETELHQGKKIPGGKWLKVTGEGYEKDNWYLEGEVGLYG